MLVSAADGPWCKLLGWGALIQLTALLFSVVVVSFATWRLVVANPLSDVHLLLAIIGSWVAAVIVGSAFWGDGIVGPYKVSRSAQQTQCSTGNLRRLKAAGPWAWRDD